LEFAHRDSWGKSDFVRNSDQREIDDELIRTSLASYGISPTADQISKIRAYTHLLLKWNRTVSLTTITSPADIVERHFGESMFATRLLPVENCRLADVGTGAGFPGLALKIACPGIRVMLIESNRKKCAFLSEVARALGISDVEVRAERFEDIRPETIAADIITARAVGEFKQLLRWSAKGLAHRGHIALWLGADDSTRIASTPGWAWQPAVHIPDSQRRFILIGRPIGKAALS
jgi:16S rRNA (guanine527-N7)-methyltransferase